MTRISLDQARADLAETVNRANFEPVLLEAQGRDVAVVLSMSDYRRLSTAEERENRGLADAAYDKILGPFDRGSFRELSEQDWQDLLDGKRTSPHDPESWALPPRSQAG